MGDMLYQVDNYPMWPERHRGYSNTDFVVEGVTFAATFRAVLTYKVVSFESHYTPEESHRTYWDQEFYCVQTNHLTYSQQRNASEVSK